MFISRKTLLIKNFVTARTGERSGNRQLATGNWQLAMSNWATGNWQLELWGLETLLTGTCLIKSFLPWPRAEQNAALTCLVSCLA